METAKQPLSPPTALLLGVPFHDVTMEETLDHMDALVARRRPGYLATANLDFAEQASRDVELQRILLEAQLVLCDGTPLVWASRWLGAPLRERVAGSDLMPHLFARAEARGHRLFFLGASEDTLNAAMEKCLALHPKLTICGRYAPPHARLLEINHAEITRQVRAAKPDILLVAMGCPKQEKWIFMHYQELGVPVSIGIGASLDFIAGKFKRAPVWMRVCGAEWIFRLLQEPRRLLGRYASDLLFFRRALRDQKKLLAMGSAGEGPGTAVEEQAGGRRRLRWSGRVTAQTPVITAQDRTTVVLEGAAVTGLDSRGLGVLAHSWRNCHEAGAHLILLQPSAAMREAIALTHLDSQMPMVETEDAVAAWEAAHAVKLETPAPAAPAATGSDTLSLEVTGELTAATVKQYEAYLVNAWEQTPAARRLELELSKIAFMESSGLGLLLKVLKLTRQRPEGTLKLREPSPNVLNVIRLANLGSALGVATNR